MGTSEMECSTKLSHIGNIRYILSSSASSTTTNADSSCCRSKNNGFYSSTHQFNCVVQLLSLHIWLLWFSCSKTNARWMFTLALHRPTIDSILFFFSQQTKEMKNPYYIFAAVSFCDVLCSLEWKMCPNQRRNYIRFHLRTLWMCESWCNSKIR